ncbi:MAG TPA: radical SAM protein [Tepidisphaeraceae bacterium]|nr:radical SAM protein [Tepidisphaeraceae bacterium]
MYNTVILTLPPQHALLEGFSSGLISLANYVADRESAVDVRLLDLSFTDADSVQQEIRRELSDVRGRVLIGVTTTTATYQSALVVARAARLEAPDSTVLLGGHHASPEANVILREHSEVDAVICGEGEPALHELIRSPEAIHRVPNIAYRDSGAIRTNPKAALLSTAGLDSIAPTYRGGGIRSARGKFDHVSYVSARGCPLKCAFCAVANERIRAKSIERVIEDLRLLVRNFGYHSIAIEDNFFAHSPSRTKELCDALEQVRREPGMDFSWDAQTRVESMESLDVIQAMRRGGCDAVYLGVESLVPEHLTQMRKTANPLRYLDSLETRVVPQLLSSDIACFINLQLGLPGETEDDWDVTIERLTRLGKIARDHRKQIVVFPMLSVIYPGTSDYERAVALGGILSNFRDTAFERFTEWEAQQKPVLNWLGRHFAHGTGGIPSGILQRQKLRKCRFEVDPDRVMNVVNLLDRMRHVGGVRVFNYSKYLVTPGPVPDLAIKST